MDISANRTQSSSKLLQQLFRTWIRTYKAEYDNVTSEETIFGGTALYRENGDHIRLKIKVEKQSGNINVIAKLGYNEKTLIDDTGEYEDNIYIEGVSYYLTIKLDIQEVERTKM